MPKPTFARGVARIVRKRSRDLVREAGDALVRGHGDELHAIRIDVKRLRYNLEFLAPFARDEALAALDILAVLQERLGTLADAATFVRTFEDLAAEVGPNDPRAPGLAALLVRAQRERERALVAARALWRGDAATYPERLAASISATLDSVSENCAPNAGATASIASVTLKARSKRSAL